MGSVITTRQGECSVLEVALPGRPAEPAGVILHDPENGRIGLRLRRDWDQFAEDDDVEVLEFLEDDLRAKAAEFGSEAFLRHLEETLSNTLRIADRESVLLGGFESTLNRLYNRLVPSTVQRFVTHLPVYSLEAAAGRFGEQMATESEADVEEWIEPPAGLKLTNDMFVASVTGRSMEPRIPAGSRCIFRYTVAGSRAGRLVLVEDLRESDSGAERFTIKRYRSKKAAAEDGWRHEKIIMEPLNPEYEPWEIDPEAGELEAIKVIAEFVDVLD